MLYSNAITTLELVMDDLNEEEETDKLLKRDHNEMVEDSCRQKKQNNKKEGNPITLIRSQPIYGSIL